MKSRLSIYITLIMMILLSSCQHKDKASEVKIVFLHHSIGGDIWRGSEAPFIEKFASNISIRLAVLVSKTTKARLPLLFKEYNKEREKNYHINEIVFPKIKPYGWHNYPYDYFNIWVKNAGNEPFMKEPTLEMLTKKYNVIVFKHCFRVSNIKVPQDSSDINSNIKTISNYKLQYLALREKLHAFPDTKFILFTGAVQVKANLSVDEAGRAREFFDWVIADWDLPDDNIFLWDLYSLQTEGELYFKDEFALSANDSHLNKDFAGNAVQLLFYRIIDVIETNGNLTKLTGEKK